jgi:hypothetical protein
MLLALIHAASAELQARRLPAAEIESALVATALGALRGTGDSHRAVSGSRKKRGRDAEVTGLSTPPSLPSARLRTRSAARRVQLADRREKLVARVLATATSFGAEPAMLVVGGVPVALRGTGEAGDGTGFDHCADKAHIRRGLADHDAASRLAGVGAVEAETDAAHHLFHVVLGEVGVRTSRTAGGTIEALADTAQERVAIEARRLWMRLNDLLEGHVSPFVWAVRISGRPMADPSHPSTVPRQARISGVLRCPSFVTVPGART